ncbi:MAG: hypothetical protein JNK85_06705 [Verrucomicrobiales bacterium]|nr:hypothetical protein [Verrucomicrobiales bacterium]
MQTFFKRLNFFKGLFATAEDFQAEQQYHIEKRWLHNRSLHSPGVVRGEREELMVLVTENGTLNVQPGCALDSVGRELYVPDAVTLDLKAKDLEVQRRLYVYITYGEGPVERRTHHLNPEYSGHAFVQENPQIRWSTEKPDNSEKLELARFDVQPGRKLTQASIDRSGLRYAAAAGAASALKLVREGTTEVSQTREAAYSEEETYVKFEELPGADPGGPVPIYVATARPVERGGPIHWRIMTLFGESGKLEYRIYLKNWGKNSVKVRYQVYRLV